MASTVQLMSYVAAAYELPTAQFTRRHEHLCERCDVFVRHVKTTDKTYPHWPTFDRFHEAVRSGCHICRLFWAQLQPEERDLALSSSTNSFIPKRHGLIKLLEYDPLGEKVYYISLGFVLGGAWYSEDSLDPQRLSKLRKDCKLFASLSLTKAMEGQICNNDIGAQISSKTTGDFYIDHSTEFIQARSWIKECRDNHAFCRRPLYRQSSRPSRLISLGAQQNFSDVHLCSSNTLDENSVYVTLSHTWGPKGLPDAAKLTRLNRSGMERGIEYEKLPKTFQDAIAFAKGLADLGVGYIWIDALCILQDQDNDESYYDWLHEGSKMDQIYHGGLCNLAASTGNDGSYGLFPDSDPFWRHVCHVEFGTETCIPGSYDVRNMNVLGGEVRSGLITSRAWCLQELSVSQRVLYFAPGRIAWSCGTLRAEDRRPWKRLEPFECVDFVGFASNLGDSDGDGPEESLSKLYASWNASVWRYSATELTRHTDKLLAISGIARQLQSRFEDDDSYLVGMWSRYLHLHLLWWIRNPEGYRLTVYRAPSWSWASAEGYVFNSRLNLQDMKTTRSLVMLEPEMAFETEDRFGLLRSSRHGNQAQLHVEGPVLPARLGKRTSGYHSHANLLVDGEDHVHEIDLDFTLQGDEEIGVLCLLVAQDESDPNRQVLLGLILIRQDDVDLPGRYIRVGVGFDFPTRFLHLARKSKLGTDESKEFLPNGDHRITIV